MEATDTLLAIDPSSSCTGYAVMRGEALIDAGKLAPNRAKDLPNDRIDAMVNDLIALVAEHRPALIVLEDTSGKVSGRHRGNGAGLSIYGKAIGEIRRAMKHTEIPVECVLENDWTRGTSKKNRQRFCARIHPQYDPKADAGGDVSDAIMLGRWWQAKVLTTYLNTPARDVPGHTPASGKGKQIRRGGDETLKVAQEAGK